MKTKMICGSIYFSWINGKLHGHGYWIFYENLIFCWLFKFVDHFYPQIHYKYKYPINNNESTVHKICKITLQIVLNCLFEANSCSSNLLCASSCQCLHFMSNSATECPLDICWKQKYQLQVKLHKFRTVYPFLTPSLVWMLFDVILGYMYQKCDRWKLRSKMNLLGYKSWKVNRGYWE